jgi:hypothetical protein
MILECDGVRVLTKPEEGGCQGLEIKNVVLYPANSPSQRWMLSEVRQAKELPDMIQGLLRKAGVTDKDTLVGVGDGAAWVEDLLDTFCEVSITDVYHATQYAERIMQELSWNEEVREEQRRDWCRGKVSVREWLNEHLPKPTVWMGWDEEAVDAIAYLDKRLHRMDYPSFKAKGLPIGSGQIEGANKWVVGARMKRSGMQWSKEGAARMACMRAQVCSNNPLVDFDQVRHKAYPPPSQILQGAA